MHMVIEGSDVQRSLLRGMIRAMNVLSRVTRGMKIHSTLDDAFRDEASLKGHEAAHPVRMAVVATCI